MGRWKGGGGLLGRSVSLWNFWLSADCLKGSGKHTREVELKAI